MLEEGDREGWVNLDFKYFACPEFLEFKLCRVMHKNGMVTPVGQWNLGPSYGWERGSLVAYKLPPDYENLDLPTLEPLTTTVKDLGIF